MKDKKLKYLLVHNGTREIAKFQNFSRQIQQYVEAGPTVILDTSDGRFRKQAFLLCECFSGKAIEINCPVADDEKSCPTLLERVRSVDGQISTVIIIGGEQIASYFPLYFLIHGINAKGINPDIINRVEQGETVVVDVDGESRNTLTVPGNSVAEHYVGAARYM